jgi:hypothetical protein
MADARDERDQTGRAYSTDLVTWHEALDHPVLPRAKDVSIRGWCSPGRRQS